MLEVVLSIHLVIAIALIGSVLLQRSEGGALGIGGGGGGGGGNLFSSRGAGSALTRTTAMLAAAFFVTSFSLTVIATKSTSTDSALDRVQSEGAPESVLPKLPPAGPQVPVSE